ncbi:MAG: hypothetical protein K6A05_05900 [Lachnospiraceae bacterium]|nr:hypothetical protein [Lachnospiraceae bacterium]
MLDIVNIKKAVKEGEIRFFVKKDCDGVKRIYAENNCCERVIVGRVPEEGENK